ncbi:hypothetical protein BWQ96_03383 [Gracilariopsis chorda]|uniref:Uncharacterized protein n=1 Tax=Gracilariopsis chorda TaxID=448386 RepID=A0A2V3IXG7_9FLOR|nr:hypothetical protein BWQ96_03383 [Gracilariopsis chorda]|eukprot:PXF46854.1 hypothetical protein BWQ96_03383 [Gracilariopsis chorda]
MVLDDPTSALPQMASLFPTPEETKLVTRTQISELMKLAYTELGTSKERYKAYYASRVRYKPIFEEGDMVYLDIPPRQKASTQYEDIVRKLLPNSEGPYMVVSATDSKVTLDGDGLHDIVSMDLVKAARPSVSEKVSPKNVAPEESEESEVQTEPSVPESRREPISGGLCKYRNTGIG